LKIQVFKDKVQFPVVFVLKYRSFQGQTIPGTQQIVGFPLSPGLRMPNPGRNGGLRTMSGLRMSNSGQGPAASSKCTARQPARSAQPGSQLEVRSPPGRFEAQPRG